MSGFWYHCRYSIGKDHVVESWKAKLRVLLDPLFGTYNALVRARVLRYRRIRGCGFALHFTVTGWCWKLSSFMWQPYVASLNALGLFDNDVIEAIKAELLTNKVNA